VKKSLPKGPEYFVVGKQAAQEEEEGHNTSAGMIPAKGM